MTKLSPILRVLVLIFITVFAISLVQAQDGPKLIGAFFVKGKVGLKWMKVNNASEYVVYRKTVDTEYIKLGTTEKTNYFDTDLQAGAVFTYKIAAVVDGNEIDGNTKDVKMPAEIDAFSAPKGVVSRLNDRETAVMIRWDKVKGSIAYNISRSTTSGTGYELVGNVSRETFTDADNLIAGTTYYYVVTAMNEEFEESDPSEETMAKFGLTEEEYQALLDSQSNIHLDSIKLEFAFEITEAKGKPLKRPANLAINSNNDIYIADQGNFRIVCTDSKGKVKFTFGTDMDNEYINNPPDGAFLAPFQITIGKDDRVYVSDIITRDIQIFSVDGKFIQRIKVPVEGEQDRLRANGLDIFDDGRILCSDVGNQRILIINSNGQILNQFNASDSFLVHFPNAVQIIDDNSFAYTNAVVGKVVVSDFNGKTLSVFGDAGINLGSFGRLVGISVSEDGFFWCTDAMGGNIQAFNKDGEVKIAIPSNYFTEKNLQIIGPRGIIVKDGMIYIANQKGNSILAFNYEIIKLEE